MHNKKQYRLWNQGRIFYNPALSCLWFTWYKNKKTFKIGHINSLDPNHHIPKELSHCSYGSSITEKFKEEKPSES
ncbi:MAG: hypothetical protein CSA20_00015 [Deltaproteobacteria bacterium]|nr:MAG: hypothetical protein CSA20_00015 [Deltaproteobacteria bacterium]